MSQPTDGRTSPGETTTHETASYETTTHVRLPGDMRLVVTERPHDVTVTISGEAPDEEISSFRALVESSLDGAEKELVLDLSGLQGWAHGAQAALLRLVRDERGNGRVVRVVGLAGTAARQAEASGLAAHFRTDPTHQSDAAATLARIERDRESRRTSLAPPPDPAPSQ
jgi:anti-anti-sigma regulatory factor